MNPDAWFTLAVIACCFVLLATNRWGPDSIMVGGLTLLLVAGVLTPEQALAGMANEGMATVGVLYVVVSGLKETGGVGWLVQRALGRPQSLAGAQIRLILPASLLSIFKIGRAHV
jgi:Na+/H+ antiporter NhaD/arsenite permease-like protein